MTKNAQNGSVAPGAPDAPQPEVSEAINFDTVRQLVERDAKVAVSFLNAIISDPDVMDVIANFFHGRYLNHKNKPQ